MQQHLAAMFLQRLSLQAFPDVGWKRPGLGQPRGKGPDRLLIRHAAAVEYHPAPAAQARAGRCRLALVVDQLDAAPCGPAQLRAHGPSRGNWT
ncbi:hypothetical protein G6F57_021244 [Rhizopus arrhizus]|nr:hypothetical protein G6F57_021244 [Rhizopus arrhizus]